MQVPIRLLSSNVAGPSYSTSGSAGADLSAAISGTLTIKPMERVLVPTGVQISLPPGFEAQVRSRSGLAANHGLMVLNSPGTIDPDYRGEIKVLLFNTGSEPFTVTAGMRIAQLVIAPFLRAEFLPVAELCETSRGSGGFGSTGV